MNKCPSCGAEIGKDWAKYKKAEIQKPADGSKEPPPANAKGKDFRSWQSGPMRRRAEKKKASDSHRDQGPTPSNEKKTGIFDW